VARRIGGDDATWGSAEFEVGVRELHDRLSRYVQHVKDGGEMVVTMRGRRDR
jgi:hypothetical protein